MNSSLMGYGKERKGLAGSAGLRDGATRAERGERDRRLARGIASLRGAAVDPEVFA